jgi:hypothetical protein
MGCRLCGGHGDSLPDHLLDHDRRPVSVCRQAYRLLGRDVGGGRYRVRLQGHPRRLPVCGNSAHDCNMHQLRAVLHLPLLVSLYAYGHGSIAWHRHGNNDAVGSARRHSHDGNNGHRCHSRRGNEPSGCLAGAVLRFVDTAVGIAVGVSCKWIGSFLFFGLARRMTWMGT